MLASLNYPTPVRIWLVKGLPRSGAEAPFTRYIRIGTQHIEKQAWLGDGVPELKCLQTRALKYIYTSYKAEVKRS